MILKTNLIGAGKLGKTMARLLFNHGLIRVSGVLNTSLESTLDAIQFIGDGTAYSSIATLPPSNLTLICTPDASIADIAETLSQNQWINQDHMIMHFSGALSAEILSPLANKGCATASLHPMRSFSNPALSLEQYPGTYCAIEGDAKALKRLKPLFEAIGSVVYHIKQEKKSIYHAAGVFASNYLLTLAKQATDCLTEAGVDETIGLNIIADLMQGTLSNLKHTQSLKTSLTGPIQRSDVNTIKKHLEAINNAEQQSLYRALGKATLPITNLNQNTKKALNAALEYPPKSHDLASKK
ncbi:MAG: DUF2520 domain-containing protein [Gammaproteobacteria bacterium]|nr:DUF2520 domain-containing protein [Gammaproteobacteria bacterium]MCH9763684.1 DUF2520 domain-containing protein [Gammaproteobacteria bacterium]